MDTFFVEYDIMFQLLLHRLLVNHFFLNRLFKIKQTNKINKAIWIAKYVFDSYSFQWTFKMQIEFLKKQNSLLKLAGNF